LDADPPLPETCRPFIWLAAIVRGDRGSPCDPFTLVRQIAELAYLKHGNQAMTDDLGTMAMTTFETFLGGHYKHAMERALGSAAKARVRYEEMKAVDQSVMTDFSEEDLFSAFEVEGLAYEYWKASAAMRSLGKGVRLQWDDDVQWFVDRGDGPDPLLFAVFDHRGTGAAGLFTRLGTWMQFARGAPDFSTIYFAAYNPNGEIEDYPAWDSVGKQIVYGKSRLNFHIGQTGLQQFLDGHCFMAPAFEERHKVKLEAVLFCLWIASFFAFFPDRAIFAEDDDVKKAIILGNLANIGFRGYKYVGLQIDTIAEEALWWAGAMRQDNGAIEFFDGTSREIDAAIRIGDRLVLVECFSFERPVDYELAKPGVFEARFARVGDANRTERSSSYRSPAFPTCDAAHVVGGSSWLLRSQHPTMGDRNRRWACACRGSGGLHTHRNQHFDPCSPRRR
jgi:hypothetical protein